MAKASTTAKTEASTPAPPAQPPAAPPQSPKPAGPVLRRGLTLLAGKKPRQLCICEPGGQHAIQLAEKGWRQLHELAAKEIRALYPRGDLDLPPRASADTLAAKVLAHALGG